VATTRRSRIERTDDWPTLQLRFAWPEQRAYELLRPGVLFGRSPAERARQTGIAVRTIYRKASRFDADGMPGPEPAVPQEDRRALPGAIREAIRALKAENRGFRPNELATICYARFGRPPNPPAVRRVLAEVPYVGTACPRTEWSDADRDWQRRRDPASFRIRVARRRARGEIVHNTVLRPLTRIRTSRAHTRTPPPTHLSTQVAAYSDIAVAAFVTCAFFELLDARSEAQASHGLEMRTELRFGDATRELTRRLGKTTRAIKSALLDQKVIAGLGNIYVDESLFTAGIHPLTPANKLKAAQIARLNRAIKSTLRRAIQLRGSTLRDYMDANRSKGGFQHRHQVYHRDEQPCHKCGRAISRIVLGGRSTHFCASCQKK